MSNERNLSFIRTMLFIVNYIIILFMSIIIYRTTQFICYNNMARDFLEKIKYIPITPWKVPVCSLSLLVLLTVGVIIRKRLFYNNKAVLYLLCISDIFLCIAIMYYLNMSYKGIIFLAITNVLLYIEGNKNKFWFLILSIGIYIIIDYDIFSIKYDIFSINDYIQYYSLTERLYIFGIRNILYSLNEVIFIIFMISVIQVKTDETKKIKNLYSQLSQTAEELQIANIQLKEYAIKSEEMAKTKERNRLAREIHDTIGHTLTGIATGLEACIELINWDIDKTKNQIIKISELARKGLVEVRRSVSELRPDSLERLALIPAIQKTADDISECTNTRVNVIVKGCIKNLKPDEEETVYRVVQEGITNGVRHGKASTINILLEFEENYIKIEIVSDGIGCTKIKEGFGLKHIRERIEMLKGNVKFYSTIDDGFKIKAIIPIRQG